jgi:regulator of cell morphogenesis and NO signaling
MARLLLSLLPHSFVPAERRLSNRSVGSIITSRSKGVVMNLDPRITVGELALETPNAARVFEKSRIDYCCGGNQPLTEACARAGVDVETISRLLREVPDSETNADFGSMSLAELTSYIVEKHHKFTVEEVQRLATLFDNVCSAHGANHPELLQIRSIFRELATELAPHMFKEEQILFPYVKELDRAASAQSRMPFAPFGTVRNPITMMMQEHYAAGDLLREIRKLSRGFAAPTDGCLSYRALYTGLQEFEADLHQHIHLENNVLFPRAAKLEDELFTSR